jgi:hypothetical protein
MEEYRLTVFENVVLTTFAPERKKIARGGENCAVKMSILCPVHQNL